MKLLFVLMLTLGSTVSVFAANGEDRVSVGDNIICQEELNKSVTLTEGTNGIQDLSSADSE